MLADTSKGNVLNKNKIKNKYIQILLKILIFLNKTFYCLEFFRLYTEVNNKINVTKNYVLFGCLTLSISAISLISSLTQLFYITSILFTSVILNNFAAHCHCYHFFFTKILIFLYYLGLQYV